jgi:hypothetical protein
MRLDRLEVGILDDMGFKRSSFGLAPCDAL